MKTKLLLSSLLLSSIVEIYGSDVVAGQNETAARTQPEVAGAPGARPGTFEYPGQHLREHPLPLAKLLGELAHSVVYSDHTCSEIVCINIQTVHNETISRNYA